MGNLLDVAYSCILVVCLRLFFIVVCLVVASHVPVPDFVTTAERRSSRAKG